MTQRNKNIQINQVIRTPHTQRRHIYVSIHFDVYSEPELIAMIWNDDIVSFALATSFFGFEPWSPSSLSSQLLFILLLATLHDRHEMEQKQISDQLNVRNVHCAHILREFMLAFWPQIPINCLVDTEWERESKSKKRFAFWNTVWTNDRATTIVQAAKTFGICVNCVCVSVYTSVKCFSHVNSIRMCTCEIYFFFCCVCVCCAYVKDIDDQISDENRIWI